jgi:hypothetical protein
MSATTGSIPPLEGSYLSSVFDPIAAEYDYCVAHGLRLSPARNHGWLLREARPGAEDGPVVACVEDSEDQFELMQVSNGFRWSIHNSLHEALGRLVENLSGAGVRPQSVRPFQDFDAPAEPVIRQ